MDIRGRFAKKLKSLRSKAGLSITELAEKCRISRQHIRELELPYTEKRVTIVTLEKIAKGLDIPVWELLHFEDKGE